jgi:hypothetical protein
MRIIAGFIALPLLVSASSDSTHLCTALPDIGEVVVRGALIAKALRPSTIDELLAIDL